MRPAVVALALPILSGAASAPEPPVSYRIAPVIADGALTALAVELSFEGDADGETRLSLPNEWAGSDKLWQAVSDLTVDGGRLVADGDAARRIAHAPGARLTVRYRISANAPADPDADFEKARPVIRPGWFFFHGEGMFATPDGRETAPARFRWQNWPANWRVASDLDHLAGRPGTVADVVESAAIGAPDIQLVERQVDGAPLRVAMRGSWSFDAAAFADRLAPVMAAQNAYWGDPGRPYFVPIAPLATDGARRSTHGTGRTDGFAIASTTNYALADATRFLAHEYMHNWIAREIGGPLPKDEAAGYWITEGFTDFVAARTLLRAGIWSLEDYAAEKNAVLFRLATSPARALPNAAIQARFWSDQAAGQLPYDRGNIFALWVDEQLRVKGGIDKILRAQRRLASRDAAAGKSVPAPELFLTAARAATGADLSSAVARYIDRGEPVVLPASLASGCLVAETVDRPPFDRGFDADATAAAGMTIKGVDPAGRAYAAGMRDGMKLVRREAGEIGNPAVEIAYRVADTGGERVLRYLPAGRTLVRLQQLKVPALTPARRTACAARL